ncbi:NAD-dependent epimerase/dehydratase family protein [Microvirga aerilata]|uniref:NAD-dependent epimerase/dehydratase family protein n=1 Tax=Microvirga aerilata TaxID=670292 RepID=UPI003638EC5F
MTKGSDGVVLVVGALGVVGRAALDLFTRTPGWSVIGLSRRKPDFETNARWINADLKDLAGLREQLASEGKISHVVYAALHEEQSLVKGWSAQEQIHSNVLMLSNLLTALSDLSIDFSHLTLLQGTKAYGVHHGPYKMPAKESDPRFISSNFYYDQEDLVREKSGREGWAFTVLRPQIVCGFALGNPMNAVTAIGVYASICRELGQPMRFPGGLHASRRPSMPTSWRERSCGPDGSLAARARSTISPTEIASLGPICGLALRSASVLSRVSPILFPWLRRC